MIDYPLKFTPILKEKIWGGNKLRTLLNKDSNKENLGESWEISGVKGEISIVKNGPLKGTSLAELLSTYKGDFLGKKLFKEFGAEFPLLIKFIDAKTPLSVQLHPNDEIAKKRHNSFGKTEMWYIVQANEDAEINIGFKKGVGKQDYLDQLKAGKITDLLHFEKVKKGDSFFINTGKIHAIGAGVLLAEIQQTSDITYRIYDWDRTDAHGNARELHTAQALDAIDFEEKADFLMKYDRAVNKSSNIARCQYFTTNFLPVNGNLKKDYSEIDSFVIFMCVKGSARVGIEGKTETIERGETLLIPARNKELTIVSDNCELLEIYID